jgi:hypothetical protein
VYPKNLYLERAPYTHAEYREHVTRRQVELLQGRGVWARPGRGGVELTSDVEVKVTSDAGEPTPASTVG